MNRVARTLLNVMRIEVLLGIGLVMWVFSLEANAEIYECANGGQSKVIIETDPDDRSGEVTVIVLSDDGSKQVRKGHGYELNDDFVFYVREFDSPIWFTSVYSLRDKTKLEGFISTDRIGLVAAEKGATCITR